MSNVNPLLFRGTLEECFGHFVANLYQKIPKGKAGASKLFMPIAEFCGVSVITAQRWSQNFSVVGGYWFKMAMFLRLLGYEIKELGKMKPLQLDCAELIGFRILSEKHISETLGFTGTGSHVFAFLKGKEGLGDEKKEKLRALCKERREAFEQAKEAAKKKYAVTEAIPYQQHSLPPPSSPSPRKENPSANIAGILHLMRALDSLLVNDPVTPIILARLPTADKKIVARLSSRFSIMNINLMDPGQQEGSENKNGGG